LLKRARVFSGRGSIDSIFVLFAVLLVTLLQTADAAIVSGVVRDASDSTAIGFATATVSPEGYSVSANLDGQYRLVLTEGRYTVKFSHVAHYSETVQLDVGDSAITRDVYLRPSVIEVSPIDVWDRQYDAAQRIIIEAIKRKDEILSRIQHYRFDAYSKLFVTDTAKADSINCMGILESQVQAFWEYPDRQKEIITARRQTVNVPAEFNLLAPGQLLNFNKNRIDLGRYAVVSPTASDALDYYDYYLIDTVYIDGKTVFVLEIEPRDENDPLFVGEIRIVDSSYAVVGVDVGFTKGFDDPIGSQERYRQVYAEFDGKYWMPTLIQFSAVADLRSLTLVYPVIGIDYQVAIHNYDFSDFASDTVFDEYAIEVDKRADDIDSATWDMGQMMPLTEQERRGYSYRDSVTNSKTLSEKIVRVPLYVLQALTMQPDFIHFNRVEGAYLGFGNRWWGVNDRWNFRVKTGYAFDAELWQHEYGARYTIHPRQKISIIGYYRDAVRTHPTIFAPRDGNATFTSLIVRGDAYDYYREKGYSIGLQTKVFNHSRLNLQYNDFRHLSMQNNSNFGGLFGGDSTYRANPPIVDGKLRSLEASFTYDSRKLARSKGRDFRLFEFPLIRFDIGTEYASRDLIDNDFNFTRYYARLFTMHRLFGFVVSRFLLYAGASDRSLPPQKYFTVDYPAGVMDDITYFHTLGKRNFSGSRVFAAYTYHDFGQKLFQKTGIPLIKHLPFEVTVHGGAFWTDLEGNQYQPGDELIRTAPSPYAEAGFTLTRIIPWGFFSFWGVGFAWQISDYDTNDWTFGVVNSVFSF